MMTIKETMKARPPPRPVDPPLRLPPAELTPAKVPDQRHDGNEGENWCENGQNEKPRPSSE